MYVRSGVLLPPPRLLIQYPRSSKSSSKQSVFKPDDVSAIIDARAALENMDAKDPRYASTKSEFKNLVRQSLQRPEQYQEQIDRRKDHDEQTPTREMLTTVSPSSLPTTPNANCPWSTAPMMHGWPYVAQKFDSQDRINNLFRNTNGQGGIRSLGIDPGMSNTAIATLIHSEYRNQQSRVKIDAGISEIEDKLVRQRPLELNLSDGDLDITVDGNSGITSNNSFTKAVERAIWDYESAVKDHLVSVARESSTLRTFYGSAKCK
ncbi:hypothetical protein BG004_002615 [Podila humilis]|nr:hypothetical protein BG004_002615 [Podila humilis]